MKSTRIALAAAGAFLLAACSFGGDSSSSDAENSSAPKLAGELTVVVDTSKSGCKAKLATKPGTCWLPLYTGSGFDTKVVNLGGGCTLADERNCWPQPGAQLPVVCGETGGQELGNTDGDKSTLWIAVAIPKGRVLLPGYSPEFDSQGRAIVFASSLWLKPQGSDTKVAACSDFFSSINS